MPLFSAFRKKVGLDESSGDEVEDSSAGDLSHVGTAAYDVLRRHHNHRHHELWNVTKGKMICLDYTPRDAFTRDDRTDPVEGHDDRFPPKLEQLIGQTEKLCDVLTLTPPDGLFLDAFKNGIKKLCETEVASNRNRIIRDYVWQRQLDVLLPPVLNEAIEMNSHIRREKLACYSLG